MLCVLPAIQSVAIALASYQALLTTTEFQHWAFAKFDTSGWPNEHGPLLEQYILGGYTVRNSILCSP